MIKEAVLFIIVLVLAFMGYCYFMNPQLLSNLATSLQPIGNALQNGYNSIPAPIKGILQIISIPSIISGVFLAWTKLKAMQKLNETTQSATTQLTKMGGQVEGVKEASVVYTEGMTGKVEELATKLQTTKTTLETKEKELLTWQTKEEGWLDTRHRLEEDIRHYDNKIKSMQYKIDVLEGRIKLPVG